MTLAIDHVIFTVRNFDAAADRLARKHGLVSVPGGRHPGHGTGNRIIPLGPNYIELMSVVDDAEAASSPLGRWVSARIAAGDGPAALCLRTDDIEEVADRLGIHAEPMTRRKPDGSELSWHLAGLSRMLEDGFPFFIEWHAAEADLPGRIVVDHSVEPRGISWVEIGGGVRAIADWVGATDIDVRVTGGPAGVKRVGIVTAGGELVLEGKSSV